MPLVLSGPGVPAGERVGHPVELTSVAPTLLRLAGVEREPAVDLLRQGAAGGSEPIFFATEVGWWFDESESALAMKEGQLYGLLSGDDRFQWARGTAQAPLDRVRLFDVATDPGEQNELSATRADAVSPSTSLTTRWPNSFELSFSWRRMA